MYIQVLAQRCIEVRLLDCFLTGEMFCLPAIKNGAWTFIAVLRQHIYCSNTSVIASPFISYATVATATPMPLQCNGKNKRTIFHQNCRIISKCNINNSKLRQFLQQRQREFLHSDSKCEPTTKASGKVSRLNRANQMWHERVRGTRDGKLWTVNSSTLRKIISINKKEEMKTTITVLSTVATMPH